MKLGKKLIGSRLQTNYLTYDNDKFLVFWKEHRFCIRVTTEKITRVVAFDLILN